jgi:hypothetical protein
MRSLCRGLAAGAQASANEVVFENPEHDFPKRIGYRLVSADSLEAWVDGGCTG